MLLIGIITKNTKEESLKNVVPTDFHIIYFPILWKSMSTVNCLVTNSLQNIFFCVQQKKETHTGLGE